jgi:hypothetical protein
MEQQLNKEFDAAHIQKIEKEINESLSKVIGKRLNRI